MMPARSGARAGGGTGGGLERRVVGHVQDLAATLGMDGATRPDRRTGRENA
jgi:hypothetical protein